MINPLRKLYAWVLSWAESPFSTWALFFLAFVESSFFPVPPDVLLIALAISIPTQSFKYALICSVGSIAGGCFGYLIGWGFYEAIGRYIIKFYGIEPAFQKVATLYQDNTFLTVLIAGFTPIPYKVFTIAGGFCQVNFLVFLFASSISRSARFFLVATLLYFFGPKAKIFIDRYFNLLTILFAALIIIGFLLLL